MMKSKVSKFVRFEDSKSAKSDSSENDFSTHAGESVRRMFGTIGRGFQRGSERIRSLRNIPISSDVLVKRQEKDDIGIKNNILDPQGSFLQKWNKIFVLSCVIAIAVDPLFFYIPVIDDIRKCLDLDRPLEIIACVLRTFSDLFHVLRIVFQFRTGFIAPSSRVFGRGELIDDPTAIARRYLSSYFILDVLSILPLPQVVVLAVIPSIDRPVPLVTKELLKIVIFSQYVPRIWRIYPLFKEVTRTSGILTETAWAGAAFNLFLYMLASHGVGAFWYLFSLERADACWRREFKKLDLGSYHGYCRNHFPSQSSVIELVAQRLNASCPFVEPDHNSNSTAFNFGIFADALTSGVVASTDFFSKFIYCFWWGLRNLSSLGQNLKTSTFVPEIIFAVAISIGGLVLFSLLIGNMQKYLQSTTVRIEEMRVKRRDAEQWMSHRMLPESLRERIRRHEQFRWQETRGVEEDALIRNLPRDLRRDIKRHLCLALLTRVPMFEIMDERLLDAMCDRLKPVLYTEKSSIAREGDPVDEMLFILRGKLETSTTNGGRTGFLNTSDLKAGDFCGEELLTWALDPNSAPNLPSSTRTVVARTEVGGFALTAEELRIVASQFRRLHSKELQHTFKFYSLQWRTWAACFIQVAWRRHCKRKIEKTLREAEERLQDALANEAAGSAPPSLRATVYASRFASNALRALRRNGSHHTPRPHHTLLPLLPQKPCEPDFTSPP